MKFWQRIRNSDSFQEMHAFFIKRERGARGGKLGRRRSARPAQIVLCPPKNGLTATAVQDASTQLGFFEFIAVARIPEF